MSWVGGDCQKNRRFECYYLDFDSSESVCLDSDDPCLDVQDHMGLVRFVDHQAPPPPPKPWYG